VWKVFTMKQVVINADDMGMSQGTNAAIARAFQEGILTSTSVMVTMPASTDALTHVIPDNPGLGIGIHLSLTEGKSVLEPAQIPLLVDEQGFFCKSFAQIYVLIKKKNRHVLQQIEREFEAQIEKIVSMNGIYIDHINSHHHVHMIPPIFDIVVRLAKKVHCSMVRLSHECYIKISPLTNPYYYMGPLINGNILKKILLSKFARENRKMLVNMGTSDYFFGLLHSANMDVKVLQYILQAIKPGVTEILSHPGVYMAPAQEGCTSTKTAKWLQSMGRSVELEALLAETLRQETVSQNIRLVRFSDVVGA
jgi:predicted glycoside hydrolase/deacetylase ChbG (UPF0249 family)